MEEIIVSLYYYGVLFAFTIMIFDYIQLNLKLGYSLNSILGAIWDNLIFFIGWSLGSWITIFMFIFNDAIDKFKK